MGLLFIDSRDRTNGTSTNFSIRLPQTYAGVKEVSLESAFVPNVIYNITSSNNVIPVIISATTYNATLTPGRYSAGLLALEMQSKINTAVAASGATFTVTINDSSFLCTITGSTTFTIDFGSATSPWRELGFANAVTASGTSCTGTNAVQLNLPTALFLNVSEWSHNAIAVTGTHSYTPSFVLPLASNPGDVSSYSALANFRQKITLPGVTFASLRIRLTDNNGTEVSLQGAEWSCLVSLC